MTCGEIGLQQNDDMDVLIVSDEALEEAACGGLMRGAQTLAYRSLLLRLSAQFFLKHYFRHPDQRTDGDWII